MGIKTSKTRFFSQLRRLSRRSPILKGHESSSYPTGAGDFSCYGKQVPTLGLNHPIP